MSRHKHFSQKCKLNERKKNLTMRKVCKKNKKCILCRIELTQIMFVLIGVCYKSLRFMSYKK